MLCMLILFRVHGLSCINVVFIIKKINYHLLFKYYFSPHVLPHLELSLDEFYKIVCCYVYTFKF